MSIAKNVVLVLLMTSLIMACPVRGGDDAGPVRRDSGPRYDGGNPNEDGGGAGNDAWVPPTGLQIKDLQDTTSPDYPGAQATISLLDVVVTSPVFSISTASDGFFINDQNGGAFSGILVTATAGEITVSMGDKIDIEGTLTEFSGQTGNSGTETQLAATQVTVRSTGNPIAATVVTANDFDSEATAEAWEGVLVTLHNVSIVLFADGSLTSFGQFQITGGALVDDEFAEYVPGAQEVFASVTGVVRYTYYGDYVILPRTTADIVSDSGARVVADSSSAAVQNPDDANHPEVCATTMDRCNPVRLTDVVVTSPVFGISRERDCLPEEQDRNHCPYYMFGFFVADPAEVDAQGRLKAWSGIKVTFIPGSRWYRGSECDSLTGTDLLNCGQAGNISSGFDTTYSFSGFFSKDAAGQDVTSGFPAIGDQVTLVGEPAEYYDMTQIGRLEQLNKSGSVTVPLPALFVGADAESIMSGMPRVPESGTPEVRPLLAPGTMTEAYEAVMVELQDVYTIDVCVGYPYSGDAADMRDFGYFRVGAASGTSLHGVEVGGNFTFPDFAGYWRSPSSGGPQYAERTCDNLANKCKDSRHAGQQFSSIKGLVDFSYGVHRLEPLDSADIACSSNCETVPGPTAACQ